MIFPSIDAVLLVTPLAIFNGRGGRNQHSPFHQAFLNEKDRLRLRYLTVTGNRQKRLVQEALIAWVTNQGGEFYKRNNDDDGTYQVMTHFEKLAKVAQALREKRKSPPQRGVAIIHNPHVSVPQMITVVTSREYCNDDLSYTLDVDLDSTFGITESVPYHLTIDDNTLSIDDASVQTFPMEMVYGNDDSEYEVDCEEWLVSLHA